MNNMNKANPTDIATGSWVARFDDARTRRPVLGRVLGSYADPLDSKALLLDIALYSHTGERIGRASPACGGPRGFEPACTAEFWEPIAKPDFKDMDDFYFYGDRLTRLRNTASV